MHDKENIIKLFTDSETPLIEKYAEVIFEDGCRKVFHFLRKQDQLFSCFESDDKTDLIAMCNITEVEDGLFVVLYYEQNIINQMIINLHRHSIELMAICSSKNNIRDIKKKTGSFYLINEANQKDETKITNEEKAVDFWLRFFDLHDETAIDDYLAEPYLQHNPKVADGVEAFRNEFIPRFSTDMKECSTVIKRVVSRDNLVFIHNILKRSPSVKGHAAVDIFRFENGKIVEHWDVIQPMPETSKNNHPMF